MAMEFIRSGPVVAKAISSGPGLAPFVDQVGLEDAAFVANAPVMLQRAIKAEADWRLVTVGSQCIGWRRSRENDGHLDWRAEDPSGGDFQPCSVDPSHASLALSIQDGLALTFSVQDWLESDGQWCFLEVNPQGQWLFLRDAAERVGPTLTRHLSRKR
jgi:glutathione synthase/RimK-type ligase-like ATP-grasp enzyme